MTAEMKKMSLERSGLWSKMDQAALENLNKMLEYEKEMELVDSKRPIIAPPPKKSWQENIWLYIIIGVLILVVGALIIRLVNL